MVGRRKQRYVHIVVRNLNRQATDKYIVLENVVAKPDRIRNKKKEKRKEVIITIKKESVKYVVKNIGQKVVYQNFVLTNAEELITIRKH